MVFIMNELLDLEPGMMVFEVGTGSGYHAATIAEAVAPSDISPRDWGHVYTFEIIPFLAFRAYENLRKAGYLDRVTVVCGDASKVFPLRIKADRIIVTASSPRIPMWLCEFLKDSGILLSPVGPPGFLYPQRLVRLINEEGKIRVENYGYVSFVPLRGEAGW